jgi:hypothetical protein
MVLFKTVFVTNSVAFALSWSQHYVLQLSPVDLIPRLVKLPFWTTRGPEVPGPDVMMNPANVYNQSVTFSIRKDKQNTT